MHVEASEHIVCQEQGVVEEGRFVAINDNYVANSLQQLHERLVDHFAFKWQRIVVEIVRL